MVFFPCEQGDSAAFGAQINGDSCGFGHESNLHMRRSSCHMVSSQPVHTSTVRKAASREPKRSSSDGLLRRRWAILKSDERGF
jgi:predicted secreted protein